MAIMTEEDHEEELIKYIMKVDNCSREDAIDIYIPNFKILLKEKNEEQLAIQYQYDRAEKYPPLDDVIVALAEKAEGRSEMWDEISEKRQEIRIKYPKPKPE